MTVRPVWRRLRNGVLLAAGLAVGAAWVAPRLFDANQHRDVIENLASGALGRSVRIDGSVALNLLPEPSLVAARVTVGGGEPQGLRITAAELRLRVGLWPLLLGHLEARDLVLSGADIHLPWLAPAGLQALRPPEWLSGLSARIDGGQIWFGAWRLTEVNAAISSDPDTGSYAIAGSVRVPARAAGAAPAEWRVNARLLGRGPDGMAGVDVTLDGPGASATLAAQLGEDGGSVGQMTVRGADLSQVMPAPKVPFRLVGRFSLADGLAAIDAMEGDVAGSPVRGAVSFRLAPQARLDVALAMTRLDLDGWVPVLPDWAARSVPGGLSVGLDVSAEAAPYAGGLLRGVRLALDVDEAGTGLREARAVLPGDAEVALTGRILPANPDFADSPRLTGQLSLNAPDLRTTLAWAGPAGLPSLERLPAGVLGRATLRGALQLAPGLARLTGVSGQIDGMTATGEMSVRAGARPAIGVQLALDRLNLDPWVAGWWSERWPRLGDLAASGAGLDLELAVTAGTASLHGQTMRPFSLELARAPARLSLNRLGFELAGMQVLAAGSWLEGKRLADGRLELRTADLTALADALPVLSLPALSSPALPSALLALLRGSGSLILTVAGPAEALAAKLSADVGDLHVDAQPTLDWGKGRWQSRLALRHPGAQRLAAQLGLGGARNWVGDGSFSLATQVLGTPEGLSLDYFDLGAGMLRATGQVALALGEVPALSGRVSLETLAMAWPDVWSAEPLALGWLAGWQADVALGAARVELDPGPVLERAQARVTLNEGRLAVSELTAELGGGKLAGTAGLDSRADPPVFTLEASLAGVRLSQPIWQAPVDVGSALVDGRLALNATGFAPAALLASLSGGADLVLRDGVLAGVALEDMTDDLPEDTVRAALAGGSSSFDRAALGLVIDHGVVRLGPADLTGPTGQIDASGQIDLVGGRVDLRLGLHPAVVDSPDIGLRLSGTLDMLSRAPELAELTRWHARHPVH